MVHSIQSSQTLNMEALSNSVSPLSTDCLSQLRVRESEYSRGMIRPTANDSMLVVHSFERSIGFRHPGAPLPRPARGVACATLEGELASRGMGITKSSSGKITDLVNVEHPAAEAVHKAVPSDEGDSRTVGALLPSSLEDSLSAVKGGHGNPLEDMRESSRHNCEEAHLLGEELLTMLSTCKDIKSAKKKEFRRLVVPLLGLVLRQDGLVAQLCGKAAHLEKRLKASSGAVGPGEESNGPKGPQHHRKDPPAQLHLKRSGKAKGVLRCQTVSKFKDGGEATSKVGLTTVTSGQDVASSMLSETWTKVMSKSRQKKLRWRERKRQGQPLAELPTLRPKDIAKRAQNFVLTVRPRLEGRHAPADAAEIRRSVNRLIDPVSAKIAIRGTRDISGGGVLFILNSKSDLERLEVELVKTGLAANLVLSRPRRRLPEIIIFGVDVNLDGDALLNALLSQNEALHGASLALRTMFDGKRGRNAIVSVDEVSYERLSGMKRLSVGGCQADFRPNRRMLICFHCQKYGHTQKVCRSIPRCGNCGGTGHSHSECSKESACRNCARENRRRKVGEKLPTDHVVGSRVCAIHRIELAQTTALHYGFTG